MGAENGPDTLSKASPVPNHEAVTEIDQHQRKLEASGAAVETKPRRRRRTFSAAEKLRVVKKANACVASGERGALEKLLRKEGIYSSTLSAWRGQLGLLGAAGLEPGKAGRKPKLDAKDRQNVELAKRNAVLKRKLHIAEAIIALQKKAHELLGIALPTTDGES
jgi:transposase-like protein